MLRATAPAKPSTGRRSRPSRACSKKIRASIRFDVPQKIKDLNAARDFGRYGSGDTVFVNFLSTTDIIGGNSGSPILNGNGEQVGICFDGNFEGVGNDFYYNLNNDRTISVDIRYVLWVTEKFAGAKWIVDEMKLVGGGKAKAASR